MVLRLCHVCMTQQTIRCNCNYAAVTKIKRIYYPKMYPTVMVLADGSTIHLRHKEPRQVLKLPLDLSKLSEEERAIILARRKPKQKVVVEEEIEDEFDVNQYSHLWKKDK
ncbi:hypothetical protein LSH36_855g01082 [Paralvinella palmiformis]|uniref:39S ribosomal protein L55, mitochondrial n=1 Tax=Paralvinella palmiformis TaxID=53620 RepID=A0AAD9IYH7_9ANNE|nr:hypothetical protein LSH36_855g01082 [Paralvinella palmiformis]